MPIEPLGSASELRIAVVLLWVRGQAERYARILEACGGDDEIATRVYREVLRAEGWRA